MHDKKYQCDIQELLSAVNSPVLALTITVEDTTC